VVAGEFLGVGDQGRVDIELWGEAGPVRARRQDAVDDHVGVLDAGEPRCLPGPLDRGGTVDPTGAGGRADLDVQRPGELPELALHPLRDRGGQLAGPVRADHATAAVELPELGHRDVQVAGHPGRWAEVVAAILVQGGHTGDQAEQRQQGGQEGPRSRPLAQPRPGGRRREPDRLGRGELEQPAGLAAQVADGDAQVGVAARSGTPSQAAGLGQGNVDRPAVGQGRIQGRIEVPREGHGRLVQDGGLHADHGRDAAAQQCRGEALGQVQGGGPSRLAGVEDDQPQPVGADHADQLVGADGIGAALAVVEQQAGGPAGRVVAAVADEVQQVEGPAGRVGRAQRLLQRGQGHAGQGHEVVVCVAAARPGPPRCLAATYPPAPPTTRATTRPSTSGARPASRARVSGQRRHRWAAMTTLLRIPFNHYG